MDWFADPEAWLRRDDTKGLLPHIALVERPAAMELFPAIRPELTLVAVYKGAEVASRDDVATTDKVERGNEVLIPVPAVKILRPSLTWNTPSAVVFWGPLPTKKSISFTPQR